MTTHKVFFGLALALIIGVILLNIQPSESRQDRCGIEPKLRVDCGYPGIIAEECVNKGCCFDSSDPYSIWCFIPLQLQEFQCQAQDPHARVNCGYPGISTEDCRVKGCCFDSSVPDVIWCFQPTMQSVVSF
ncbi:putative gastrointestinal growth factor xP4 [Pleurodeles waltl]|uniref:putative gastrointestinal growth factor xP4 n=1 Tax=Pleurodeles waltl TaxID=8319 RepID=UPI0037095CC0